MARKKQPAAIMDTFLSAARAINDMPAIAEVQTIETPSRAQLGKMLARYRATIAGRFEYAKLEAGIDKLQKALELIDAANTALAGNQYADARQLVGLVQGILYALDVHRWDFIATDDER